MKLKFLKNAAILTVTGFLLRGLGMVFRVYISSRIGEEGMGVYQLISSAYFLFITLAQSGLSVTVTRLCSAKFALCEKSEAQATVKSALKLALSVGSFAALCMFLLSNAVSEYWIGDIRAVFALRTLAFSLPFISVCGVFSGYFIANKNVIFGCAAQIFEQISRLIFAAAAIVLLKDKSLSVLLCGVFFANTVSEAVSCLYLGICYLKSGKPLEKSRNSYTRKLLSGAVPVALSRYLSSGLHTAENMLVPGAISVFTKSRSLALAQFGALKGMTLPLLFFPFSFINALSTLLVPEITEAYTCGREEKARQIVHRTCSVTLTLSIMVGGVFFMFAENFGILIYKSENVAEYIRVLAPIVPFMYLDSICDGLLKGLGKQKSVLFNGMADSGLRIILIILLVPNLGMKGFLIVMLFSNVTVSLLNFSVLLRAVKMKCDVFRLWIRPFLWAVASAIVTKILPPFGATIPKTVMGCALFCLVFGCLALIFSEKNKKYKNN